MRAYDTGRADAAALFLKEAIEFKSPKMQSVLQGAMDKAFAAHAHPRGRLAPLYGERAYIKARDTGRPVPSAAP